jgi:hypothetical protein
VHVRLLGTVERREQGVHRVVEVGGVDQRRAGVDQRQPAGPGAGDDAADELFVARAPDEVRADRDDGRAACLGVGGEGELLGERLRARVVPVGACRVGGGGRCADQRLAAVGDRRGGDVDEPLDAGRARRRQQVRGALDVRGDEVLLGPDPRPGRRGGPRRRGRPRRPAGRRRR